MIIPDVNIFHITDIPKSKFQILIPWVQILQNQEGKWCFLWHEWVGLKFQKYLLLKIREARLVSSVMTLQLKRTMAARLPFYDS